MLHKGEILLVQIAGFVREVYFALRGIETRQVIKKIFSLVFIYKGKNKGKRSFLWQQTCGKHRKIKGFQRIG